MGKVFVELFRFDSHTDYLPYYVKHAIEYGENETVHDLFEKINTAQAFGFDADCICKINNYFLSSSELVADVVRRCGSEIRIDPASEFLAYKDLRIDKSSFIVKANILAGYLSKEEMASYLKKNELDYFSSNTLNYNREYIGDHVLLMASNIIEKRPELEEEILGLLMDKENGIWYHSSSKNRLFSFDQKDEETIENLMKKCLERARPIPKSKIAKSLRSFFQKEKTSLLETSLEQGEELPTKVTQEFSGFNIASYEGLQQNSIESLVKKSGATYIDIPSKHEDLAPYSQLVKKEFSYKIAGDILLQAMDKSADFIVVKNEQTRAFFDENQAKMEEVIGREIGLSVISQGQFVQLLEGERDSTKLGFDDHKVKISFL